MKNMNQLVKQAQQMQAKMSSLQNELSTREMDILGGSGMVKIKINGKQEILELKINRECVDPEEVEVLEDLIKSAVNKAVKDSQDMVSDAMSKATGGMKLPGLF
jgi:DNA-binding YbaB/EbfC family protein